MQGKIVFGLILCIFLQAKEPEVYFTARTDLAQKCIECVKQENNSIRIVSHRLSHTGVIASLIQACKRGVSVEVIIDPKSLTKHCHLRSLVEEGGKVFVWNGKDRMHHAFCVFGKESVWTGSYTFSLSKRFQHREGALVLSDDKVAKNFFEEFEEIKKEYTVQLSNY